MGLSVVLTYSRALYHKQILLSFHRKEARVLLYCLWDDRGINSLHAG